MATKANSQKTYVTQSANIKRARRANESERERERAAAQESTNNPRSQKAFYKRLVLFTTRRRSVPVCECKTKATQR